MDTTIHGNTKYWIEIQGHNRDCVVFWDFSEKNIIESVEVEDFSISGDDLKLFMGERAYRKFHDNVKAIAQRQISDVVNGSQSELKIIPVKVK